MGIMEEAQQNRVHKQKADKLDQMVAQRDMGAQRNAGRGEGRMALENELAQAAAMQQMQREQQMLAQAPQEGSLAGMAPQEGPNPDTDVGYGVTLGELVALVGEENLSKVTEEDLKGIAMSKQAQQQQTQQSLANGMAQ